MIPIDTSPDVFWRQIEYYRRIGRAGRMRLMEELCEGGRRLASDGVRKRHPEFHDAQVRREVIRILYEVAPSIR
jgi:hypothetical protein